MYAYTIRYYMHFADAIFILIFLSFQIDVIVTMHRFIVLTSFAIYLHTEVVSWVAALTPARTQKNNHQNISTLLDNLLRGYDNSIRPDFGGKQQENSSKFNFCLFKYLIS